MVLTRRPILSGLVYGLIVYVVMNFLVLPMTAVPPRPTAVTLVNRVNAVLALMFWIGLPIAILTKRGRPKC